MDLETALALSRPHLLQSSREISLLESSSTIDETTKATSFNQRVTTDETTRSSLDDSRLPEELLFKIIDLFVPRSGISISNDPDYDVYLLTIRSLLQTCYRIKREILSRTFGNPLHIYITNGKRCRCNTLDNTKTYKNIFRAPLGKALRLPLAKWREIAVHIMPTIHQDPRKACPLEMRALLQQPRKDLDPEIREMKHGLNCVVRQSKALGTIMAGRAYVRKNRKNINWKFVFDETRDFAKCSASREIPLWTRNWIFHPLGPWSWTSYTEGRQRRRLRGRGEEWPTSLPPIHVPPRIGVGVSTRGQGFYGQSLIGYPELGYTLEEALREMLMELEIDFLFWWHDAYYANGVGEPSDFAVDWRTKARTAYTPFVLELKKIMPSQLSEIDPQEELP